MAAAAIEDLLRIPGMRVARLVDARWNEPAIAGCQSYPVDSAATEEREFKRLAAGASVLVIAPETFGALSRRVGWALESGGRLLGPGRALVDLASDKHRLAEWLIARGVPAPRGVAIEPGQRLPRDFSYPAVLKPRDGAGSIGVRRISTWRADRRGPARPARLEAFYPGIAASVAVLCGPGAPVAAPACGQRLSDDGRYRYLGAWTPLPRPLSERAARLALRVVDALDQCDPSGAHGANDLATPRGYLGVDLVLGDDDGGANDVAIEVNPRLTTSYVALRRAVEENVMAAMLAALDGRRVELRDNGRALQFELAAHARLWSLGG